eukprot:COSAG03_NODE_1567_length_3864_cov_5.719657_3_plen_108_part_00
MLSSDSRGAFRADISYTTVATAGLQFSADVLLLDYYILNTPMDLEKDSVWGINVFIWVGMFLYSSQFCLPFALHSPLASELISGSVAQMADRAAGVRATSRIIARVA